MLDTTTDVFFKVAVTGVTATKARYAGAAAVGTKVYFSPAVSAAAVAAHRSILTPH